MNLSSLSAMTGLPATSQKAPRKPVAGKPAPPKGAKKRPGRGKPGASHLAQLTQAHGAGNFAQAKTHALNYAKAVHQHMNASAPMPMSEPDTDDVSVDAGPTPQPMQPASTAGASGGVSRLISLMRKRSA